MQVEKRDSKRDGITEEEISSSVGANFVRRTSRKRMCCDPVWSSQYGVNDRKWIHKIPEKFQNVIIDYYAIMPDHVHLVLFILNDWDDHMGSPLQLGKHGKYTVSNIMDWFKTMTTNEHIRMVREGYLPPFKKTCGNVLLMTV